MLFFLGSLLVLTDVSFHPIRIVKSWLIIPLNDDLDRWGKVTSCSRTRVCLQCPSYHINIIFSSCCTWISNVADVLVQTTDLDTLVNCCLSSDSETVFVNTWLFPEHHWFCEPFKGTNSLKKTCKITHV